MLFKNGIDCAIIKGELVARSRLPGDRFIRKGAGRPQPLKRIFQELGMPPALRSGAVLLETGGGLVFCEGAGAGAGCGVTEATRQALAVEILPGEA